MKPFRDLPIQRKVASVILLTSTIVVLLTSAAFTTYEWVTHRTVAQANLAMLSRIIADNTTAALRFREHANIQGTLATLRAEPNIVAAAIYDQHGLSIATYTKGRALPPKLTDVPASGYRFRPGYLANYLPIVHAYRPLGTLVIEISLAAMERRLMLYAGIVLLILLTSVLVAFALSAQLQGQITRPIEELAKTAQAITAQGDYSVRATRYGDDELGALTDAFNRMLEEIKERERRLSTSEERLRVALAAADMGTWRYYPRRRESILDENFRRIYNLPAGNGLTRPEDVVERMFPDDRAPVRAALKRALEGPDGQFAFEYRVTSPQGEVRWVRDRGRVVRAADGSVDYMTGALMDITDRKKAEDEIQRLNADLERRVAERTAELQHANRELEAFTYSVSHDLRGPLRHMTGYVEMVGQDEGSQLSAEARRYLERISHAAARLTSLVDSLLNLSRVGRQPLTLLKIRLDDVLNAAWRELESETKGRNIEWQRSPLPTVDCDVGLMHIVFQNLLSNALKYSRTREVTIITTGTLVENGRTVVFIQDNGVGYDPRFQEKLFGVFERLHGGTTFEGTGVGLAIVDRIIRKHGGRIWAKGEVEKGATFFFTLPGM